MKFKDIYLTKDRKLTTRDEAYYHIMHVLDNKGNIVEERTLVRRLRKWK
jgi:hypothetical protein